MADDPSISRFLHRLISGGLGVVAWSEEKARAFVAELIEKGEISSKEGDGLLKSMLSRIEASTREIETKVSAMVQKYLKKADICHRKKELEEINNRITKLEDEIKKILTGKNEKM